MRGLVLGLVAMLVLPLPAAAQDAGALPWLTGKWCAPSAQQGTDCLTYTPKPDGAIAAEWASQSSDVAKPEHSEAVMRVVDGRLTLHSDDQDSDFREVSRGPNELVLELTNTDAGPGSLRRVRYRVEGDDLILEMEFIGGKTATDRYRRED